MIEIITLTHAYLDSRKIKRNEYIDHFWRSVVWFFLCLIPMVYIDVTQEKPWEYPFLYVAYMIVFRIGVYDFALNKFRGLNFGYISKSTTSVIDQFYIQHGINQNVLRIICLITALIYRIWSLI